MQLSSQPRAVVEGRLSIRSQFDMRDWAQMDRFIADTHGEDHVLRNRPLFEWFFVRAPETERANLIVAFQGDTLISLLGYMPTKFRWGGETVIGAWMAHWMTREGHRHGVGALLMKKITELFPVVAGQGASLMNQAIVTKMKFRFTERMPKAVYVFNGPRVREAFNCEISNSASIDRGPAGDLRPVSRLTPDRFAPDWSKYPSLQFATLRDAAYLGYRYLEYPFFNYLVFVEGESDSPAVCVARLADTTRGIRVARILEFFFAETPAGRTQAFSLARRCLAYFKAHDCDYADFYCTAPAYTEMLIEAGFAPEDEGVLPSLLDPIDFSRRFQNLELYVSPALRAKYPGGEDQFTVTRADGDQDRPNESYLGIL